jgi:hypothetical protein
MRTRSLLLWIAVGLTGLALAAGVSYAATQLSSQRIGLSAEPPSAGEELAPPAHRVRTTTTPARTATQTTATTPEPGDDARGGGGNERSEERGEGGHGGGLDD